MQRDGSATPFLEPVDAVQDLGACLRPGRSPVTAPQLLGLALLATCAPDLVDHHCVRDSPQVRRFPGGGSLTPLPPLQEPEEGCLDEILTNGRQRRRAVPLHCTDQHLADPADVSGVWILGM